MVTHTFRFVTETSEFGQLFEEPNCRFSTSTFLWLDIAIASSPMLSKYLQVHNNYQVAFEKEILRQDSLCVKANFVK